MKARIDPWTNAAFITESRIFRPVTKAGVVKEAPSRSEGRVEIGGPLCPGNRTGQTGSHDLRRTCAKLCRKAGGDLEQIQLLLAMLLFRRRSGI